MDAGTRHNIYQTVFTVVFTGGISWLIFTNFYPSTNETRSASNQPAGKHVSYANKVNSDLRDKITQLNKQLSIESTLRKQLDEKLHEFSSKKQLKVNPESLFLATTASNEEDTATHEHESSYEIAASELNPVMPPPPASITDETELANLGLDLNSVSVFKQRVNRIAEERRSLTQDSDSANPGSLQELDSQTQSLKAEMTEEQYDRSLYASGMPNRLVITAITPNSPAQDAGLVVGDIIISFNGKRVFNWVDLRISSQATTPELVSIELQRNEEIFQAWVPLGPLGIQTNPMMHKPI